MDNPLIPITIYAGVDFTTTFTFTNESNTPIDISGNIVCAELRKFETETSFVSFDVDYSNAINGQIRLSLKNSSTLNLEPGRYYYDILLLETTGNVLKVVNGYAIVSKSITPPLTQPKNIKTDYLNKFGAIVTGYPISTPPFNLLNNIEETTINEIGDYGVIRIGLFSGCGDLSELITYLNDNDNLNKLLNYVKNGGVLWFNTERNTTECSNQVNTNNILTKLGSIIRMNGDVNITANMIRSNQPSVVTSEFPEFLYANGTAIFDYGVEIYGFTSSNINVRTMVYQKIDGGVLIVSGDVNTYEDNTYALRPPNELYDAMRSLVSYLNS
jgi:hypothetical protein